MPRTFRALIIDDDRDLLLLVRKTLEFLAGWEVVTAASGAAGIELARSAVPDVVLVDLMMPEMDGYEVCRRLKAEPATREVPVIFVSVHGEAVDKVKAFGAGGADYVTKP